MDIGFEKRMRAARKYGLPSLFAQTDDANQSARHMEIRSPNVVFDFDHMHEVAHEAHERAKGAHTREKTKRSPKNPEDVHSDAAHAMAKSTLGMKVKSVFGSASHAVSSATSWLRAGLHETVADFTDEFDDAEEAEREAEKEADREAEEAEEAG